MDFYLGTSWVGIYIQHNKMADTTDPINGAVWLFFAGLVALILIVYPFVKRKREKDEGWRVDSLFTLRIWSVLKPDRRAFDIVYLRVVSPMPLTYPSLQLYKLSSSCMHHTRYAGLLFTCRACVL